MTTKLISSEATHRIGTNITVKLIVEERGYKNLHILDEKGEIGTINERGVSWGQYSPPRDSVSLGYQEIDQVKKLADEFLGASTVSDGGWWYLRRMAQKNDPRIIPDVQLRVAHQMARAYGHHWANASTFEELQGLTLGAITQRSWDAYGDSSGPAGIDNPYFNEYGQVEHTTGSGGTYWRVEEDGMVTIKVFRPVPEDFKPEWDIDLDNGYNCVTIRLPTQVFSEAEPSAPNVDDWCFVNEQTTNKDLSELNWEPHRWDKWVENTPLALTRHIYAARRAVYAVGDLSPNTRAVLQWLDQQVAEAEAEENRLQDQALNVVWGVAKNSPRLDFRAAHKCLAALPLPYDPYKEGNEEYFEKAKALKEQILALLQELYQLVEGKDLEEVASHSQRSTRRRCK